MIAEIMVGMVALAIAFLFAWVVPSWVVSRMLPLLKEGGHTVRNYRGKSVPVGLGIAWIVWAAAVGVLEVLPLRVAEMLPATVSGVVRAAPISAARSAPILLVAGAFAFGMIDDVFGSHRIKGFRGHVRELLSGRISTGGLKLLGIGLLSLIAGSAASTISTGMGRMNALSTGSWVKIATWLVASAVIALTANFVNLTDLRPGRATKAYVVLAVMGLAIVGVFRARSVGPQASGSGDVFWTLCLAMLVLGPALATLPFDLRERGMLGDAGANAMGALAGYLLVLASPLWLDTLVLIVMLALNIASERVSFSAVIERVAFLRWLDLLGRPHARVQAAHDRGDDGAREDDPAAEDDGAGRDGGRSQDD